MCYMIKNMIHYDCWSKVRSHNTCAGASFPATYASDGRKFSGRKTHPWQHSGSCLICPWPPGWRSYGLAPEHQAQFIFSSEKDRSLHNQGLGKEMQNAEHASIICCLVRCSEAVMSSAAFDRSASLSSLRCRCRGSAVPSKALLSPAAASSTFFRL